METDEDGLVPAVAVVVADVIGAPGDDEDMGEDDESAWSRR